MQTIRCAKCGEITTPIIEYDGENEEVYSSCCYSVEFKDVDGTNIELTAEEAKKYLPEDNQVDDDGLEIEEEDEEEEDEWEDEDDDEDEDD